MKDLIRTTLGPLFLMLTTPIAIAVFWITVTYHDGSLWSFAQAVLADPAAVLSRWPLPTWKAAGYLVAFAALQAVLLVALPGKRFLGPVTPQGNRPTYKLNGIPAWFVTHGLIFGVLYPLGWFDPSALYREFGAMLTTLTLFALVFCLFLYVKGTFWPTTNDGGRSGNFIWDFYWGIELHPQLGSLFNLKQYVNCRLSMMGWSVLCVTFLLAQYQALGTVANSMVVSVLILVVYLFKFFWWEGGYFGSMDIQHDRFGYYIAWGVLAWVPGVYDLAQFYLVSHPVDLHPLVAVGIAVLGLGSIWVNYEADAQRLRVRLTDGKTTIWGRPPVLMTARYRTGDGQERENLLLASGWWGVARHFHYVPEILLALAWSLPAGFDNYVPYFYVTFLTILLFDRAGRDEVRCSTKYGADWDRYRAKVRWRIVPFVY